jgi:DNA-binding transcriptional ArsR family regulator
MTVRMMENKAAVAALAALAFETRLEAVQLLATVGEEGLAAGELSRRLGVQQNTMSDHLSALTRAGILTSERQSRSIIYRANPAAVDELISYLGQHCKSPKRAA